MLKRKFRVWHSWIGITSSFFLIGLSITGLLLNHSSILSKKISPECFSQHPHKIIALDPESHLLVTRYNLFILDTMMNVEREISFPQQTKYINKCVIMDSMLYISTQTGFLYKANRFDDVLIWEREFLPELDRIYDLSVNNNQLLLLSDTGLYTKDDQSQYWHKLKQNHSKNEMYDVVKQIHTGFSFQPWLKIGNSISTVGLLFLIGSGIYLFFKKTSKNKINS